MQRRRNPRSASPGAPAAWIATTLASSTRLPR
jgi:hypothetical protein